MAAVSLSNVHLSGSETCHKCLMSTNNPPPYGRIFSIISCTRHIAIINIITEITLYRSHSLWKIYVRNSKVTKRKSSIVIPFQIVARVSFHRPPFFAIQSTSRPSDEWTTHPSCQCLSIQPTKLKIVSVDKNERENVHKMKVPPLSLFATLACTAPHRTASQEASVSFELTPILNKLKCLRWLFGVRLTLRSRGGEENGGGWGRDWCDMGHCYRHQQLPGEC